VVGGIRDTYSMGSRHKRSACQTVAAIAVRSASLADEGGLSASQEARLGVDNFIISTTSTLEGYEIERYLGIVAAHVVAGTDVFKDIAASFTDFFGGRSRVYKRELSAIGAEAIEELREQSACLGGNALVGIRIDHDEISGGGKQMFMVTASGTAVLASPIRRPGSDFQTRFAAEVRRDALANLLEREETLQAIATGKRRLDTEALMYLVRHRMSEAAPYVVTYLEDSRAYKEGYCLSEETLSRYIEFFRVIPEEHATAALYEALGAEVEPSCANDLLEIVDAAGLADYDRVFAMLQSPERGEQLLGVRILGCSKRTYTAADVSRMEECCTETDRLFPAAEVVSSTGKLSGREKRVWACECGRSVDLDRAYCTACGRNRRGVRESEAPIDQILEKVGLRVVVLRKAFGEASPPK